MPEEPEVGTLASRLSSRWQYILDKLIPHTAARWISFSLCLYVYILRVYFLNGWYIVTYGLGIYLSNQILGFIQPQVCRSLLIRVPKWILWWGYKMRAFLLHSIHLLQLLLLLLFLFPHQFDPDDAGPDLALPVSNTDEFRCYKPQFALKNIISLRCDVLADTSIS